MLTFVVQVISIIRTQNRKHIAVLFSAFLCIFYLKNKSCAAHWLKEHSLANDPNALGL